jgi:hypothetical protein
MMAIQIHEIRIMASLEVVGAPIFNIFEKNKNA